MSKCNKCKKCKDADRCDKFYINEQHKATLTIGKNIDTGEAIRKSFTARTQEEALDKMYKYKLEMKKSGENVELKRTEKTIAILAKEIEESKYRMSKTKANAYNTNMSTLERIKKHKFANIPIEKVTKKQIEDYLENHNSIYKNIILLCLYTGMRIGEVLALNYNEDIDLDNKMIKITKTLTKDRNKNTIIGPTKTKSGKRNIEINELTENVLKYK